MNERNQELIVDLIGGRLSRDEELEALARIENDADLRSEYQAQMSAVSILRASSTPSMTPEERSTLHAALRRQLHLDDSPVPVVAGPSRWQRWWAPLGGLAVAAAVVFGAVVVLPGALSGDDSDGSFAMVSAEIDTTVPDASAADGFAGDAQTGVNDAADAGAGDAEAAPPEVSESALAGGTSADEEIRSTTTAAAYDAAEAPADIPYLSVVDLDALESELTSNPESLRNSISTPSTKSSAFDVSQVSACLDLLRADDTASSYLPIATTTYEGTGAVVVSVSPLEGDSFLAAFALDSCTELANTRG